jgi:hypothetical protein
MEILGPFPELLRITNLGVTVFVHSVEFDACPEGSSKDVISEAGQGYFRVGR